MKLELEALEVLWDRLRELGANVRAQRKKGARTAMLDQLATTWKVPLPDSLQELLSWSDGLEVQVSHGSEVIAWRFDSAAKLIRQQPRTVGRTRIVDLGEDGEGRTLSLILRKRRTADAALLVGPTGEAASLSFVVTQEAERLAQLVQRLDVTRGFASASLQHVSPAGVGFASIALAPGSALAPLVKLGVKDLALSGIGGHDLAPLADLPTLRSLELRFEPGASLDGLTTTVPQVISLEVTVAHLDQLAWLQRFPAVRRLKVNVGALPRVLDASSFALESFELSGFRFEDRQTHALERLLLPQHLESLDLKFLDLPRLPALPRLDHLRQLCVHMNPIEALTLPPLPRLENLQLGQNQLQRLDGLSGTPAVTRLNVAANRLSALDLAPLGKLKDLDASENRLIEVPRLGAGVVEVNLAKNRLRGFEALVGLPPTVHVDLRGNDVPARLRAEVDARLRGGPRLTWAAR
jgi:hypothetical protein